MRADLLAALRLCDGSLTLDQVARESGVARERLMELEQAGQLIVWPYRPAPALWQTGFGIILSPHLDDAALSLGAWMLWKGHDRDYYRVVDVFSTVSWWRCCLPEGLLPRGQQTGE